MGVKKYIFFSLVLIALCGLYVFTFQDGSYLIEFFGVPVTLKIAVWVVLPMLLLAVFSVLHIIYHNMKFYMSNRALIRDYETYKQACKSALLNEETNAVYKTEWFKLSNQMLSLLKSKEAAVEVLEDENLKKICEDLSNVQKGEYVDLKAYKLNNENPIFIENRTNQLKQDPKVAFDILRNCEKLETPLCQLAYNTLIKHGSYSEIKRVEFDLRGQDVITLIKRKLDKEDNLFIEDANLGELIENGDMTADEYVEVAKLLKRDINPDTLVAMFEKIYANEPKAGKAYFYTLFELQMIDRAREVLQNTDENEFEEFKILLFLRENGKNSDIKYFI